MALKPVPKRGVSGLWRDFDRGRQGCAITGGAMRQRGRVQPYQLVRTGPRWPRLPALGTAAT